MRGDCIGYIARIYIAAANIVGQSDSQAGSEDRSERNEF